MYHGRAENANGLLEKVSRNGAFEVRTPIHVGGRIVSNELGPWIAELSGKNGPARWCGLG